MGSAPVAATDATEVGVWPRFGVSWSALPWWTVLEVALAAGVVAVSGLFLSKAVRAEMSLSLWQDELYSIDTYSSRGVATTVATYNAANNHIFFNLLNAITPGAGSFDPARARLWSIVATVATPVIGLAALSRRRMVLAGALVFAVFSATTPWLQLSMQARGYGLLGLACMVIAVAVWQHLETGRVAALVVAATASVIGCWTVPSFAFFVGPLWIAFLATRRTRRVVIASLAVGVVTIAVYLPVAGPLTTEFRTYGDQFGELFHGFRDVVSSVRTYLMGGSGPVITIAWGVGLLAATAVAIGRPAGVGRPIRDLVRILLASVCGFFLICVILRTVPLRTTAFAAVALGMAIAVSLGALARQTSAGLVHVATLAVVAVVATLAIPAVRAVPDPGTWLPLENWKGTANFLVEVLPAGTKIYADPPSPNLGYYLDHGQTMSRTFSPQAFTRGEMAVVGFDSLADEAALDLGVPYVETDVKQERGHHPPHSMRVRFAPVVTRGMGVTVAGQAVPELTDGDLQTGFTSPAQDARARPDDIVVDVPDGPTRSVVMSVLDDQAPRPIAVSTVAPDGTTTRLAEQAITRSRGTIVVALGDRPASEIHIDVGPAPVRAFALGEIWIYRPSRD